VVLAKFSTELTHARELLIKLIIGNLQRQITLRHVIECAAAGGFRLNKKKIRLHRSASG